MKKHIRTKEEYEEAIMSSRSIAEALRKLGLVDRGGNYRIIRKAAEDYGIDMSHFEGQAWNKGLKFNPSPAKPLEEVLVEKSSLCSSKVRNRLLKTGIKERKCERCGRTEWEGVPIPIEVHHINGNSNDNRLINLMFLCPNCHALTDNYRRRKRSAQKETTEVEPV